MVFRELIMSAPWLVVSAVMLGITLAGWFRTRATGALLIAIGSALQIVYMLCSSLVMWLTMQRGMSASMSIGVYGGVMMVSRLVTNVLIIVGVALLVRRVATHPRK